MQIKLYGNIFFVVLVADPFRKPRLMKKCPSFLERIAITMSPSVDKFEEDLCQQMNEDRINRENRVADGATYTIAERRLQVCIRGGTHNSLQIEGIVQLTPS